jgi:Fic family protein
LLVVSKKPLKVKFLSDNVFEDVLDFFNLKLSSSRGGQLEESGVGYDEIETLLKRLLKDKKNINFAEIAEEQKIEFTSASTQLEGNTFTLEESRGLILQDIVPPEKQLKEANEVKNYFNAVNYLIANLKEEMSVSFILELHKITTFNLNVAQGIRTSRVSIAGNLFYKVAKASEILGNLNELCKKINDFLGKASTVKETIIFATFVHNEFQHIHPFEDGNSRTTRLLWNFVLMRKGFPLINLYSNARQEYLSLTKLAKERNDSRLNIFLLKIIKDNLFKLLRS